MMGGADGTISVTANVAPALMAKMCSYALSGDSQRAREIDERLGLLHRNLFLEANPGPVKWALWKMGLMQKGIRLPLVELDAKFHIQVIEALVRAGIELPQAA